MTAVVWNGPDQLIYPSIPVPQPAKGEALVRVSKVGICGSDLAILRGHHARALPGTVLGHEFCGTVAEDPGEHYAAGTRVAIRPLISCRDRAEEQLCVACRTDNEHVCAKLGLYGVDEPGALAPYVLVRSESIHPVPAQTPEGLEGLAEPLAVAVHAVSRSGLRPGSSVAVFGGGPIGLLVALVARQQGAAKVVVIEPNTWRQEVAKSYGLDVADSGADPVEEVLRRTGGDGADIVFDSAGHPSVAAVLTGATRIQGTIMIVGVYKEPAAIDLRTVNFGEQQIVGTRVYRKADFQEALNLLANDTLGLAALPTLSFPLLGATEAFQAAARGNDAMKVFITPGSSASETTAEGLQTPLPTLEDSTHA
ncbi:alcohol dehydrogenase catalytic domain-containing protein [Arthrobacter sp. AB6]|uniref:zinc-dependent alcohol dehydrogenase n=1 Tax=Arthrobacter sp. AB6 TaxID=2962570 RepID=UPI0028825769|nr:alcohol dehydrogenase catalytic domain-containing protein [Arthrobacter sp. AB6]MDT0196756.1 alcohol dehydrogenase catalytic domain-containing protein [Arthrobacter sp. AB6]